MRLARSASRIASGNLGDLREEAPLTCRVDSPIRRHALISVPKAFTGPAVVEVAPRRVDAGGGDHMIEWSVEIEVIIFVDDDRHESITRDAPHPVDQVDQMPGTLNVVAMQQEKVTRRDDLRAWKKQR